MKMIMMMKMKMKIMMRMKMIMMKMIMMIMIMMMMMIMIHQIAMMTQEKCWKMTYRVIMKRLEFMMYRIKFYMKMLAIHSFI